MNVIVVLFWLALLIVFYTYIGYALLLGLLVKIKGFFSPYQKPILLSDDALPSVTLVVAAYNEADCIAEKIHNSMTLQYPTNKLQLLFVTDGSTDNTNHIISQYPNINLQYQPQRSGKIAAVHRIMPLVKTPIVIYTDANTMLNPEAVHNIVRHYNDPKVGAVAGEKRVYSGSSDSASGAGEGFYWRYESLLKKWDSALYSVVGAAGELFSIRTNLYEAVPTDTIIEDFYMTLRIAQQSYRVVYEPEACATELPSASTKEELKRKIRIAAGGWQSIMRLLPLLNIFRYGVLSFQYISHRVLRWTITPFALLFTFLLNGYLVYSNNNILYKILFTSQLLFYILALIGYILSKRQIKQKVFFIPFYFCFMNYAVFAGLARYLKGNQSVVWEKAKRSTAL
jgi:cellulose synthase/poly-beta-1,6-N-acetylglucosamine synthase-like glycosyltransferase